MTDWIAKTAAWFRSLFGGNRREAALRLSGLLRTELDAAYRELTHLETRETLLLEDGAAASGSWQKRTIALKIKENRDRIRLGHCKMRFLEREVDHRSGLANVMASDMFLDKLEERAVRFGMSAEKVEEFCRVAQEKWSAAAMRSDMILQALRDTEKQFAHSLAESSDRELDEIIRRITPEKTPEAEHRSLPAAGPVHGGTEIARAAEENESL